MLNMIVVASAVVPMSIGLCINLFILSLRFIRLSLLLMFLFIALAEYILIRLLLAIVGG